jgi:aspartate aminotransferase, cytoplasmic
MRSLGSCLSLRR